MAPVLTTSRCSGTLCTLKPSRRLAVPVCASASGAFGNSSVGGSFHGVPARQPAGVFQITGSPTSCTLVDVRDAYEACSTARTASERQQCFEVYGLDSDKVDRYYERVVAMERLIDQGDSVGQNMVASGGAMMLYFMAYCILKV